MSDDPSRGNRFKVKSSAITWDVIDTYNGDRILAKCLREDYALGVAGSLNRMDDSYIDMMFYSEYRYEA